MIAVRPAEAGDRNFLVDAFRRSWEGAPMVAGMDPDDFYPWAMTRAKRLFAANDVLVACAVDDLTTIIGWACISPSGCLHYMFVRKPMRDSFGVEEALLTGRDVRFYSHKSRAFRPPQDAQYRPDLGEP